MTSRDRLHWRTSSYSGTNGGQCVQVAFGSQTVFIRDSRYLRDPANDPAAQPIVAIDINLWLCWCRAQATGDLPDPELPRSTSSVPFSCRWGSGPGMAPR
ncbi:DUF397 domain-containing protein [Nocardia testacea]|uniref:DUF397 domain-containing protein n=1 Tax=Nocardia testacea TaxID=248551 RepID=UPI003A83929B